MEKTIAVFVSVLLLAAFLQAWAMKEGKAGAAGDSCLNVATFNLRMDTPADGVNAWPNRKEMVKGLIRFHDFDIFGTQEGFMHMLDGIVELDGYAYIGAGRDDGEEAGEHSAIFYKTGRFELLDKGNFWFSETPEVPGKGWDVTCCNRICLWASSATKRAARSSISSTPTTTTRERWHAANRPNCCSPASSRLPGRMRRSLLPATSTLSRPTSRS
ncbi:MAG: hypothetical protein LUH63_22710 [Parabacteroides sp.]|nr:hypothetical protein [Parabacteroides sp.]